MNTTSTLEAPAPCTELMLGDEAVALGAIHAGITAAYAYPGTPVHRDPRVPDPRGRAHARASTAHWCANEKTAVRGGARRVDGRPARAGRA